MDQALCRLCAPSGAGNYQREIRQFVWSQRSEKETDLILISGDTSLKVHRAIVLPLSAHLAELLPASCPCTKPAICLPPFSSHVLTAAVEILYTGTTTIAASQEDQVQVKEVFALMKIKADINIDAAEKKIFRQVEEDLEAMFASLEDSDKKKRTKKKMSSESASIECSTRTMAGGVEPNDRLEIPENEQQITLNETFAIPEYEQKFIPPQNIHSFYLNEVTGEFCNNQRERGLYESNSYKNHEEICASSSFNSIQSPGQMTSAMILDEATGVFCYDERQNVSGLDESENCKINNHGHVEIVAGNDEVAPRNMRVVNFDNNENESIEEHEHEIMKYPKQAKRKDLTKLFTFGSEEDQPSTSSQISKLRAKKRKAKESDEIMKGILGLDGNILSSKKLKVTELDGSILSSVIKTLPRNRKLKTKLACSKCEYTTTRKDNLNRHCYRMHLKILYNCNQCDYKTTCCKTLKMHIETVHEKKQETKLACSKCDYTTERKDNLNRHFDSMHKKILYNCNQCDYKTVWGTALTRHIETMHEKKPETKLACNKCDYTTKRKDNLNKHFDGMHKKILYNCNQCDYTTMWRQSLTMHIEAVHENNSYSCDKCDFKSTSKLSVQKHIECVHQEIYFYYNCNKCEFTTTHKQNLKNHIDAVHLKISHTCDQCNFTTKSKRALKKHIQVAHQNIGFNCTRCEFKTMWKSSLKKHIKGMHAVVSLHDYQHNQKDVHKPSLSSHKSVDGEVTTNCHTRAQKMSRDVAGAVNPIPRASENPNPINDKTEQKRVQKKSETKGANSFTMKKKKKDGEN